MMATAIVSMIIVFTAWQHLLNLNDNIEIDRGTLDNTPYTAYKPSGFDAEKRYPVAVISHGFAGSQQLMQPLAYTLAHNGYIAITFDYLGHGRHTKPLGGDIVDVQGATENLIEQTRTMVDFALRSGKAQTLALVGHSMASDIVVRYAKQDNRVAATVAISMFSPAVSNVEPKNLLVIAGDWEQFLKTEAMRVLAMVTANPEVAKTYGSFADGSARRVVFSDNTEHISVLYSTETMLETVHWLNQFFHLDKVTYIDDRGFILCWLFIGIVLLAWPLSKLLPKVSVPPCGASLTWKKLLPIACIPALVTPILLISFPPDFLSLLVGGYLAVHFAVYGLITMLCLWFAQKKSVETSVNIRNAAISTVLVIFYTSGVTGYAIDTTFTSFSISANRFPLMLAMLIGTLSYFIADEWLIRGPSTPPAAGILTKGCFLLSLGIAVALSLEELFFLLIISVVILLYFIVYGLFNRWTYRATGHPLIGAVASAFAFAWALTAVFPILSG